MFTIVCIIAIALCIAVDYMLAIRILSVARFWLFQGATALLTIFFDVMARGRAWSVMPAATTRVNFFGTPVELLVFGFVMLYAAVICYELLERRI